MKIRNSSRITAIVLALVMLLPLISIPTFAEEPNVLWSENFDSFQNLDDAAFAAKVKANFTDVVGNMTTAVIEENSALKFPMAAKIEGTKWDTDFYIYTDGYNHFGAYAQANGSTAHTGTANWLVESYDTETNLLVLVDKDDATKKANITITPAKEEEVAAGFYGTFLHSDYTAEYFGNSESPKDDKGNTYNTWKLTTGEYAACIRFGDGSVLDKLGVLTLGERTFYTAEEAAALGDPSKEGTEKSRPKFSSKDYDKLILSMDVYIEEGSKGMLNNQLNRYAINNSGNYNQNFTELFNLNLETGACTGIFSGLTINQGEWTTLKFLLDLDAGTVTGIVNGRAAGSATAKGQNLDICSWTISKIGKQSPAGLAGSYNIGNMELIEATKEMLLELYPFDNFSEDFESYETGTAANTIGTLTGWAAGYTVANVDGDKALAIPAKTARDQSHKINNASYSADHGDKVTLSIDWYITTGAQHQLQVQGLSAYTAPGASSWNDIYVIKAKDGDAWIQREAGQAAMPVPFDTWFTVEVEWTLSTHSYDVYIDGKLAMADQAVAGATGPITAINANSIIVAKENKAATDNGSAQNEGWATGTIYIDDIKLTKGATAYDPTNVTYDLFEAWNDDETGYFVEDIDEMTGAFRKGSAYLYPEAAYASFNGEGYFTALNLPLTDDAATLDKMLMPILPGTKADTVILNATYVVSADAEGVIESELYDTGWQHLYNIDATNSSVNGHPFVKGTPFDITVVLDYAGDGASARVYMDNVLVNERTINDNYFSAGEWSVMKVQKNAPAYAGEVSVLAVSMDTKYAETETLADHPLYLYEQEGMFDLNTLPSAMTAYNGASIRLYAPHGLRFATEINTEVFAEIVSYNMKIGTIIAPKEYVDLAADFTKAELSKLNYVTSFIDVQAELGNYYKGEGTTAALPEGDYMVASIVNIKETNLEKEFVARGYIEFTVAGETYIYYADLDENIDYGRTVAEVAAAALESGDYTGTAAEAILNSFIPQ